MGSRPYSISSKKKGIDFQFHCILVRKYFARFQSFQFTEICFVPNMWSILENPPGPFRGKCVLLLLGGVFYMSVGLVGLQCCSSPPFPYCSFVLMFCISIIETGVLMSSKCYCRSISPFNSVNVCFVSGGGGLLFGMCNLIIVRSF